MYIFINNERYDVRDWRVSSISHGMIHLQQLSVDASQQGNSSSD